MATGKGKNEKDTTPTVKRADVVGATSSAALSRVLANGENVTPAMQARLLNKSGIALRNRVRKGIGDLPSVYVSRGDTLTDEHKVALAESFGFILV